MSKTVKHFLGTLVIFWSFTSLSQANHPPAIDSVALSSQHDSLWLALGINKGIPAAYSLSFLVALSHYPDLDSASIEFKNARIKTTLNARPKVFSLLFKKRDQRKYVIRVNTRERDSLILLKDVPFNAQIGLFGHELAHFQDYRQRSFSGVLKRLFSYSSRSGKERYEKEIDSLTISYGLGWPLYDWAYYVLFESLGTEKYKAYKRMVYLKPEEISTLIQKLDL